MEQVTRMLENQKDYVIDLYRKGKSFREIATELNTYPNKVLRNLVKWGEPIRSKSEAQKLALATGKSKPPLLGKKRTEKEKDKISKARSAAWANISEEDRQKFKDGAKERWNNLSEVDKQELQSKAGEGLRIASIQGSKAERFLYQELKKLGYETILHDKSILPGEKYEIDLHIPDLLTIIEIDGPQHFLPVFGEEKLQKVIEYDAIKSGLLIARGFCVIRVKYLTKHISRKIKSDLLELVSKELEKIKQQFPAKENRLIEVEIK